MTKKLLVALAAVGLVAGAGPATALVFGTSTLIKSTVNCNLAINKSLPACAVPPTTYTSAG